MKQRWQKRAWDIHQRYIKHAQHRRALMNEGEIINFLSLALCGEVGELANLIKKMWRGDTVPTEKLRHELADIRIYLEHLSTHLNIELNQACEEKLDIVAERLRLDSGVL